VDKHKKGEVMHNDGGKELSVKKKVTIYVNRNSNVIRNPPLL